MQRQPVRKQKHWGKCICYESEQQEKSTIDRKKAARLKEEGKRVIEGGENRLA